MLDFAQATTSANTKHSEGRFDDNKYRANFNSKFCLKLASYMYGTL